MSYGNGRTIGSDPYNFARQAGLDAIQAAGYRGTVSVTAYFGADIYTVTDEGWEYEGYKHHTDQEYIYPNYAVLYSEYITKNKTA